MGLFCKLCEKYPFCSETKKFIATHKLKIETHVNFQIQGLFELYDNTLVKKALALLDRIRRWLGFKYKTTTKNGISVYSRDLKTTNEKIKDYYKYNEKTHFYEANIEDLKDIK